MSSYATNTNDWNKQLVELVEDVSHRPDSLALSADDVCDPPAGKARGEIQFEEYYTRLRSGLNADESRLSLGKICNFALAEVKFGMPRGISLVEVSSIATKVIKGIKNVGDIIHQRSEASQQRRLEESEWTVGDEHLDKVVKLAVKLRNQFPEESNLYRLARQADKDSEHTWALLQSEAFDTFVMKVVRPMLSFNLVANYAEIDPENSTEVGESATKAIEDGKAESRHYNASLIQFKPTPTLPQETADDLFSLVHYSHSIVPGARKPTRRLPFEQRIESSASQLQAVSARDGRPSLPTFGYHLESDQSQASISPGRVAGLGAWHEDQPDHRPDTMELSEEGTDE